MEYHIYSFGKLIEDLHFDNTSYQKYILDLSCFNNNNDFSLYELSHEYSLINNSSILSDFCKSLKGKKEIYIREYESSNDYTNGKYIRDIIVTKFIGLCKNLENIILDNFMNIHTLTHARILNIEILAFSKISNNIIFPCIEYVNMNVEIDFYEKEKYLAKLIYIFPNAKVDMKYIDWNYVESEEYVYSDKMIK